jgi:hypothetical protein
MRKHDGTRYSRSILDLHSSTSGYENGIQHKDSMDVPLTVKTATLAAMVHSFKENGFTTHLHQVRDKYWWSEVDKKLSKSSRCHEHDRSKWKSWSWQMEKVCRGTVEGTILWDGQNFARTINRSSGEIRISL